MGQIDPASTFLQSMREKTIEDRLTELETQLAGLVQLVAELHTMVYTEVGLKESESSEQTSVDRPDRKSGKR